MRRSESALLRSGAILRQPGIARLLKHRTPFRTAVLYELHPISDGAGE
ncbi:MAG: hypothetical protein ACE5HE_02960 [Phycisphaerae bacterium]